jgi:hypothetical protein
MMPMLSRLARDIFVIPATSAPSERTFSSAVLIITESRTFLNTDHMEELIFCRQNYRHLPSLSWKLDEAALEKAKKRKETHEDALFKTFNNC